MLGGSFDFDLDGLDGLTDSLEPGLSWVMFGLVVLLALAVAVEIATRLRRSPVDRLLRRGRR